MHIVQFFITSWKQDIMRFFLQLQDFMFYVLLIAITSGFLIRKYVIGIRKTVKTPPEPEGSWPIIGHLHLFGGANQLLHRKFAAMADKLGPIFSIRLGTHRTIVVSSWEIAKECFTTNDKVFSTRPRSLAAKIIGYDHAMFGFSPYGQYWRDIRKLAVIELLSNQRLELLKHVWQEEIDFLVKELYMQSMTNAGHATVDMKEKFEDLAMNIIVRVVAGKRYFDYTADRNEKSRQFEKAIHNVMSLIGMFLASDTVPVFGWLDYVKGYVGEMKRTAREIDCMIQSWVDEHRRKRTAGKITEKDKDFIHVMLSVMDDGNFSAESTDKVIKATNLSLILGGYDTTAITLTWAVSLLLNNQRVLKKAQEELDTQVGKQRQVSDSDIKNLVYLQAIVKETLRLYPAAPLSAPREALKDCRVAGFNVPAGTRLLVNLYKLHRDPDVWSNPSEFQPERFLKEHPELDVRGQDFEFLPFGSGRRMCPGVSFALQVMLLTLARLLHGFELGTASDIPVDMSESPGLSVAKATPLEVVVWPRLPSTLSEVKH